MRTTRFLDAIPGAVPAVSTYQGQLNQRGNPVVSPRLVAAALVAISLVVVPLSAGAAEGPQKEVALRAAPRDLPEYVTYNGQQYRVVRAVERVQALPRAGMDEPEPPAVLSTPIPLGEQPEPGGLRDSLATYTFYRQNQSQWYANDSWCWGNDYYLDLPPGLTVGVTEINQIGLVNCSNLGTTPQTYDDIAVLVEVYDYFTETPPSGQPVHTTYLGGALLHYGTLTPGEQSGAQSWAANPGEYFFQVSNDGNNQVFMSVYTGRIVAGQFVPFTKDYTVTMIFGTGTASAPTVGSTPNMFYGDGWVSTAGDRIYTADDGRVWYGDDSYLRVELAGEAWNDCNSDCFIDDTQVACGVSLGDPGCQTGSCTYFMDSATDGFQDPLGVGWIVPASCDTTPPNGMPDECDAIDCNSNGVGDWFDIAQGTSTDCQANGVPDECDIAGGTSMDCQPNGMPDECELAGNDCNTNSVPDDCDIALGTSEDCQPDGIPDECQLSFMHEWVYRWDDGTPDDNIGFYSGGYEMGWINHFNVQPGAELIGDISLAWGLVANGTAAMVYLWSDPNGDGDPSDAQVLTSAATAVQNADTGIFNAVDMPDTYAGPAGTSFFVGAIIVNGVDEYPGSVDYSSSLGESWVVGDTSLDPNNLGAAGYPPTRLADIAGLEGNWLLIALGGKINDCNENGTPDDCDIAGGTSADCQPNGIPDECELDCNGNGVADDCESYYGGDFDADGYVDLDDFDPFADCLAGPGTSPAPTDPDCVGACLAAFDFDTDGDVDLGDFGRFQQAFGGTGGCMDTLLTGFDGYANGTEVMFQNPRYSGATDQNLELTPDVNEVTDEVTPFAGDKCFKLEWQFVDTALYRWMRATSHNADNLPNPTIELDKPIRVRLRLDSGSLRVTLGIRETGTTAPVGEDGGTTGTIEWVGASSTIGTAPQGKLMTGSPGVWQTFVFDPGSDPVMGYTGDGTLSSPTNKGTLENLAFSSTGGVGPFTVYVDQVQQLCEAPARD